MQMSLNQMDMNVVMYPEITGALPTEGSIKSKSGMDHSKHNMGMKMESTQNLLPNGSCCA
jgi:hypothetical protein